MSDRKFQDRDLDRYLSPLDLAIERGDTVEAERLRNERYSRLCAVLGWKPVPGVPSTSVIADEWEHERLHPVDIQEARLGVRSDGQPW